MNCLEFRRLLLVQPRNITSEHRAHMERCSRCAEFAESVANDEDALEQALLVPVPDGLADRVLLRHSIRSPNRVANDDEALKQALLVPVPEGLTDRVLLRHSMRSPNRWSTLALAASLIIATGVGFYFYEVPRPGYEIVSAQRSGANQRAVAAISYVLDREPQLLTENRAGDPKVMHAALSKLGLSLPANIGGVRYLGKSVLSDGATGEHIVLQTPYGHVTLILMPEDFLASRLVVSDRNLQALAAPRRQGCYLLVADSAQTLKRVEAMLL